jgi:hypothetical protein
MKEYIRRLESIDGIRIEKIEKAKASDEFLSALTNDKVDSILFQSSFCVIYEGVTRKIIRTSYLKIQNKEIDKDFVYRLKKIPGFEAVISSIEPLFASGTVLLTVQKKVNGNTLDGWNHLLTKRFTNINLALYSKESVYLIILSKYV